MRSLYRVDRNAHLNRKAELAHALGYQVRAALSRTVFPTDAGDWPAITVPRTSAPIAPAVLAAAAHPGDDQARREIETVYVQCLAHYRSSLRPLDAEEDNVGAALAHFVAANLAVLRGVRPAAGYLAQLERQLSVILESSPAWVRAGAAERQCAFEKLAILAVFVETYATRAQIEGAAAIANVRRAARGYLRTLLGIDPAHLALGAHGLALA